MTSASKPEPEEIRVPEVTASALMAERRDGGAPWLLDCRENYERRQGYIPGSKHIVMREIPSRLAELDHAADIVVICAHGNRSYSVAGYLIENGFRARSLEVGLPPGRRRAGRSAMTESAEPLTRVMVIAAHPDDPEFGCAGTVVKWSQAGKQVSYVLLTSGDKGSHDPDLRPGRLAARRESEQRAAAAELGVSQVIFLRHPDGILENTLELRRELTAVIREHRPHIVLTIDPWRHYQLHPDHRAAGQAALDAVYAAREWYIFPEQLVEDVAPWRVREAYLFWTVEPDYWEDITCCMDAAPRRIDAARQPGGRRAGEAGRTHSRAGQGGRRKAGLCRGRGVQAVPVLREYSEMPCRPGIG